MIEAKKNILELYNHMPKGDLIRLLEYRYWKHYHVKNQQYEEATKFRSLEKGIDFKWNNSNDGMKLTENLKLVYGKNCDILMVIRDIKINNIIDEPRF